ncbi:hypothetical protein CANINC_000387 [Pichia inconspicua]|uniref:NEDD8-activating enzyme E1 regulatory subunit n=1 Tax=Pichia inconspicua TaxID=52247 RepID=A0A4T0X689_9ASCO|nr:hypothetical protein CANINC_000387 [[Candida] inconspicua]
MHDDALFGSKYDRQLRLWNIDGQNALSAARVLLVNVSAAAAETLKNLVLPGVSHIDILDNGVVTDSDVSANFFLPNGTQGKSRATVLAENLQPLNPEVTLTPLTNNNFDIDSLPLNEYTLVIFSSNISTTADLPSLAAKLHRYSIPLVVIDSLGFYAYISVHLPNDRLILQTHSQIPPDLRINSPWPELADYIDKTDTLSNVPYAIFLAKLYQPGDTPSQLRSKIANVQTSYEDTDNVANFTEARNKAHLALADPSHLSEDLITVFNDKVAKPPFEKSTLIQWILIAALHRFYQQFHTLPLTGELPDMEASTDAYMSLKSLHEEKAASDFNIFHFYVKEILQSLHRSDDEVDLTLLRSFIRNCRRIKLQVAVPWTQPDLSSTNQIYASFARLYTTYDNTPPSPEFIELNRANGKELHNIAAIIGGIAAQEIVKIITQQYIPIDNGVVFDGIQGKTISFSTLS